MPILLQFLNVSIFITTNQICNVRQIVYWKHSENIKIIKKETEQHMSWILVKFLFTIIIPGNNNDWKQGIDNN